MSQFEHLDLVRAKTKRCMPVQKFYKATSQKKNAWVIDELNATGQVNLGSLDMAEFAMSPTGFNG